MTNQLTHMLADIAAQVGRVTAQHGPITSHHQGGFLLLEEYIEYALQVLLKERARDNAKMYKELVDLCCVAIRIAISLDLVVLPEPPTYEDADSGGV